MENEFDDDRKDGHEKEDMFEGSSKGEKLCNGTGVPCSTLKSGNLLSRQSSQQNLTSSGIKLQFTRSESLKLFPRRTRALENKIPRHMVSLDEKYLHRCLELIHISASRSAHCNIPLNLEASMKMGTSSYHLDSAVMTKGNTRDLARVVFELPLASGPGNVVIGSAIVGYKSIVHILDRPLLQKLGAFNLDSNIGKSRLNDVQGSICNGVSSPSGLNYHSPQKPEKESTDLGGQRHLPGNVQKLLFSVSSTNSTCSSPDHSFSSAYPPVSQGTLQCTWKDGVPHFVFSLDDQKETYSADLSQVESVKDEALLDYSYLFHLRKGGGKENETQSHLVGKMKVSTTFSLSSSNSKIMEREFVLFNGGGNTQAPNHDVRKNKGLPRKVVDAFRNSRSSRERRMSRLSTASSTLDFCSWETYQESCNDLEALGAINLLDDDLPPNLESVAIVVKDHIPEEQRHEVGGWGMKFLRKASLNQATDASEASTPSTSMVVMVPAGIHGGPRTRNGGPSSLIERWKSGGCCDCGGWDLGCPLTVLNAQLAKEETGEGQCKLIELFIQGSRHGAAGLRIANIHDDLYFVQFQSKLSALQSFSIAVACIHSQSPRLRPKTVQELK